MGTALKFLRSQPDGQVRLLTNDTGPRASARAVGLHYLSVPEDWLLAAEPDETEKQLNRLRAENDRLRTQEPAVEVEAAAPFEDRVQATLQVYTPVSSSECDALITELANRFPVASDFGPKQFEERLLDAPGWSALLGQWKERFEPATAERISEYKAGHAKWLEECPAALNDLATMLNKRVMWPRLTVRMRNTGTRPAEDALLTLGVAGTLFLMPPRRQDEDDEEKGATPIALPRAPVPPQGVWRKVDPFSSLAGTGMMDMFARANLIGSDTARMASPYIPRPRDSNTFYFKEGRRGQLAQVVSYECVQWRHAGPSEEFEVDVLCPLKPGNHRGLITASAQAANLTDPVKRSLPVSIEVHQVSCLEQAKALVQEVR